MVAIMLSVMKSVMLASNSLKIGTRCNNESKDDFINHFSNGCSYDSSFVVISCYIIPNPILFYWLHRLLIGQNLYKCL